MRARSLAEHLQKLCFVDDRHAERPGLLQLRAGLLAREHVARLPAHAAAHPAAGGLDLRRGLLAGQRWQRAGQDERLVRQRGAAPAAGRAGAVGATPSVSSGRRARGSAAR